MRQYGSLIITRTMGFTALQILLWDDDENLDLDAEFLEDLYACWSGLKVNDCLHMWMHYRQLHTPGYRLRIVKEHRFQRIFICPGTSHESFRHCRPFIAMDGTFKDTFNLTTLLLITMLSSLLGQLKENPRVHGGIFSSAVRWWEFEGESYYFFFY